MSRHAWVCVLMLVAVTIRVACADTPKPATDSEPAATRAARFEALIADATKAIAAAPNDKSAYARRAGLYSAAGEHALAIADCDQVLKLDPQSAAAYDLRGSEHFTLGHIDESIDNFDRFIKLRPAEEPRHWKRGISYYYAGKWEQGRRQFEGYQTFDDNDVENAVWRYLCMARAQGVDAARKAILPIKMDGRVPMMTVYDLYAGRARPEDVLTAANAGSPAAEALNARLFYAHLYLGLYFEAAGDSARALEHIATAAEEHKIGHYMWNVADIHARRLKQSARP